MWSRLQKVMKLVRMAAGCPPLSLPKISPGSRPNGEANMRRTRHFGQIMLDTAPGFGIISTRQRGAPPWEKAVKRFLVTWQ